MLKNNPLDCSRKRVQEDRPLPTVNYKYEKRQKEIEKKKKRAEKDRLKEIKKNIKPDEKTGPSAEK
jgi:hypothetical protein